MKHSIFRLLVLSAISLILGSCSVSIPEKLDRFVDKAELNSSSYDANDWQKSLNQYAELVNELSSSGKQYSDAEKEMAARAMGRYHSLLIKNGIEASATYIKELKSILPSYLEGLVEGLDENSDEIGKSLEGLFDNEELYRVLDNLGEKLEGIVKSIGVFSFNIP